MPLTPDQWPTLKAHIAASPDLNGFPNTTDGNVEIANLLNLAVSPAFTVWRTSYSPDQMRAAITLGGGTTQLDALTGSKRDSLFWYISGAVNPSLPATQTAFNDLCGSQATLKASLVDGGKRPATRGEKLYATGTGTSVSPATLVFEGPIGRDDVEAARNS